MPAYLHVVCVCVYVCMYVCVQTCIRCIFMCICIVYVYMYIRVYMYVHEYLCIDYESQQRCFGMLASVINAHVCSCVYVCVCICVCCMYMYMCMSVHLYAYTCIYTRLWVYICTRVGAFYLFVLSNPSTTGVCIIGVFKHLHACVGVDWKWGFSILFVFSACCWREGLCFCRGRDRSFFLYISLFLRVLGLCVGLCLYTRLHTHKLFGYLM